MNSWLLVYEGYRPHEEGLRESLCTLGNGYFATRGAAPEAQADGIHYPGTYLAGGYNRLSTEISGKVVENEDLVNLPNWLPLNFRIQDGEWFNPADVEILSYRQELDLKKGILFRKIRFRDRQGRQTKLESERMVHMGNKQLAAVRTTLTAENWSGEVEIFSAVDGRVVNAGVERYKNLNSKHLEPLEAGEEGNIMYLKVRTNQSRIEIAQAVRTCVYVNKQLTEPQRRKVEQKGYIAQYFTLNIQENEQITIEKTMALFTSRDNAISECGLEAHKQINRVDSFQELLESHTLAWRHLWRHFHIELDLSRTPEENGQALILNLYTFHLVQTASFHSIDRDIGVPSRGWHGEAYRGHIFWDELFIFPLLNLRVPEITRALLMYRYRRLDEARAAAREEGYKGAMYPWQSGSNGREESQRIHLNPKSGRWIPDNSRLQRHVNAAIAYNIWQYYQVTDDREFLSFYGAEMILEIARFWGSIARYSQKTGRYEILGVMGPDEYHDSYPDSEKPGLNNNAYTNLMAVWVLRQALEILDLLPEDHRQELREKIKLGQEEIECWQDISRKMKIPFHDDGIISQFDGYEKLEEFDWEGYRKKYEDIQRLDRILEAEDDTPNRYKASKQADVLMLFYLFSSEQLNELFNRLGYNFEYETIPKNIDYYLKRTSHGSTLSRVVHSWVLARSDRSRSWSLFNQALQSDVADIQGGTTPEGIHLGAMAGTVDLIQRCYTGIETRGDVLWFNPVLPERLDSLSMLIRYRGHTLQIDINKDRLNINSLRGVAGPIKIGFKDEVFTLHMNQTKEFII